MDPATGAWEDAHGEGSRFGRYSRVHILGSGGLGKGEVWVLRAIGAALGFAFAALTASSVSAVNIDWVQVGNPGNPTDTANNCGSANCGSRVLAESGPGPSL